MINEFKTLITDYENNDKLFSDELYDKVMKVLYDNKQKIKNKHNGLYFASKYNIQGTRGKICEKRKKNKLIAIMAMMNEICEGDNENG